MAWFYRNAEGEERGPVEEVVLKAYAIQGRVTAATPVRAEDSAEWAAAGETGLARLFARGRGAKDPFAAGANEPVTLLLLLPGGQMANYCLGQAPLVIGSASDCDVVIAEEQGVSGKQASLALRNGKVFIENIGCATKLNGLDVLGSAAVHTGDSIQVGCWNAVIRMREPVPDVPEPEQTRDETVAQRPFTARVRDSFRAASRRIALAAERRKHEASLASFVQDLDASCIAIGEKAEKTASGNAPCAWQADVAGNLSAVARARDSLSAEASARDARTAELSQASGVRRDAKAEHAFKVAAIDRELAALTRDMASKELERQKADSEIAALDGKLKLVQNAIAAVGSGQVTESAEDLLGAKAAITRKIDAVTEARDAAAAAAAKFKELAAAKTREREAAAKAGAALDAAERAAAETEKAAKAAFDLRVGRAAKALQDARGELGRAMLKHVAVPEGFDGLYAAARAAEAGRTDSEVRIASVRNDIEAVAPEVRRLAIGACAVAAVTVVLCVALAGGAFRRWRDEENERRDGEMFARAAASVMEMLGRQQGETGEQQPATQGAAQPNALMQAGSGWTVTDDSFLKGAEAKPRQAVKRQCTHCRGTGTLACNACNKTGKYLPSRCNACNGTGFSGINTPCRKCGGSRISGGPCPNCNGTLRWRCPDCGGSGYAEN